MNRIKLPATYQEQIDILKQRGCIIENEKECERILANIGYYRLSAYFLPYKQNNERYITGTKFKSIYQIYEFDRKLRSVVFGAIEIIEINLRSIFSYYHSMKYGSLGYLEPGSFNNKHNVGRFKTNLEREINNNKKVLFVKHHINKYNGNFPLWVIIELFTFGMLSYFYNDLKTADKKSVAALLDANYHNLVSWMRCCTDLRNICAHYGRLYYRIYSAAPSGLNMTERESRGFWGAIMVVKSLFPSKEIWNNEFLTEIEALFSEYNEEIDLKHLAFPEDWRTLLKK
ncbi:MAG: Abi family protein [Clostridiales bacterium]|nr:Abi family protein [Clostridiales bacterium]